MIFNNKRGQLMDILFVFTTLVFCSIVMIVYLQSQSVLPGSLVSPVVVLELSDTQMLFEDKEYDLLRDDYCSLRDDVGKVGEKFCSGFGALSGHRFFENIGPLSDDSGITSGNFCEKVYTFTVDSDNLKVVRGGVGRKIFLEAQKANEDIEFPIFLEYRLEKEYLLTSKDCK